ncbi:hypothetical protein DBR06_SOUSAS30410043, partial [Sousa chinensis]
FKLLGSRDVGILALIAQLYKNVLSKKYDQTTEDSY